MTGISVEICGLSMDNLYIYIYIYIYIFTDHQKSLSMDNPQISICFLLRCFPGKGGGDGRHVMRPYPPTPPPRMSSVMWGNKKRFQKQVVGTCWGRTRSVERVVETGVWIISRRSDLKACFQTRYRHIFVFLTSPMIDSRCLLASCTNRLIIEIIG